MSDDLIKAISNLDEEQTVELVRKKLLAGESAFEIVEQCRIGVEIVGKKYAQGSYFLADLVISEDIFKEVMAIVEPHFPPRSKAEGPVVVMGTIEGDIHDLGKNITVFILRSLGYIVYDLGVDVPPEVFVRAVQETGASVLGVSVLLTFCIGPIKKIVTLLEEADLRKDVCVIIGGSPVNERINEYVGADYFVNDISNAVKIFQKILPVPANHVPVRTHRHRI